MGKLISLGAVLFLGTTFATASGSLEKAAESAKEAWGDAAARISIVSAGGGRSNVPAVSTQIKGGPVATQPAKESVTPGESDPAGATRNPVLEDAGYVMSLAVHVRIDMAAVEKLAAEWAGRDMELPRWEFFVDMKMSPEDRFDHFMLGNCLNFAYTDFKTGETYAADCDGKLCSGADGMWASLQRAEADGAPILDGKAMRAMTPDRMGKFFGEKKPIPLLEERSGILNAVGRKLAERYGGRFHNMLKGEPVSWVAFVNFLAEEFPESFRDVAAYKGREVRFYKRAQLATAMAYENLRGTGFFEVRDPENATVFADYEVPKTLRHYGVLVYDDALADKVDQGGMIEAGSEEEVEIRAGTVLGSDLLKGRINDRRARRGRPPITNLHLDKELWFAGTSLPDKHHLTRTTAY